MRKNLRLKVRQGLKRLATRTGTLAWLQQLRRTLRRPWEPTLNWSQVCQTGALPLPRSFVWEPTNRCNLRCKMCFQKKARRQRQELATEEIQTVLAHLPPGMAEVNLIGAEPFMRQDIFQILDLLEQRGIAIYITTNGTLLTNTHIVRLSSYRHIQGFGLSIDGPRAIHNRIRGSQQAFDQTVTAARQLGEHFKVSFNCVMLSENLDALTTVIALAASLKLTGLSFQAESFASPAEIEQSRQRFAFTPDQSACYLKDPPEYELPPAKYAAVIAELQEYARLQGIALQFLPRAVARDPRAYFAGELVNRGCRHLSRLRINARGEVVPCQFIRTPMGSLLEQPLETIWNNQSFRTFRKVLLKDGLLPICRRCCYVHLGKLEPSKKSNKA